MHWANRTLKKKWTYQTFPPVLTSYIWAVRLHPVAKNFPSFENLTQQTTLDYQPGLSRKISIFPPQSPISPMCLGSYISLSSFPIFSTQAKNIWNSNSRLMIQSMYQPHVQNLLTLTTPNSKPIRSLLFEFPRNIVRIQIREQHRRWNSPICRCTRRHGWSFTWCECTWSRSWSLVWVRSGIIGLTLSVWTGSITCWDGCWSVGLRGLSWWVRWSSWRVSLVSLMDLDNIYVILKCSLISLSSD